MEHPGKHGVQMSDFVQPAQNPHEDRITAILQRRAQPQQYDAGQINTATNAAMYRAAAGQDSGVQQILDTVIGKPAMEAQDREFESSKALYDIFEQKRAAGDAQAKALFDKVALFTGGDPEGTALFVNELHNDPESIDPSNAYQVMTKLAGIAKKTGYKPLDVKQKEAQIAATNALTKQRVSGGGRGGSSVFAQTMAAIDSDPNLKNLPTIDKIRLAQNRVGTNLRISDTGEIEDMPGASEGLRNLKIGEESGKVVGKDLGETEVDLKTRLARMPQLEDTAKRLSALGKLATYTMTGRARDTLVREVGFDVPDSAVARTEYISMVDNEILPLLRETFGAQFTEREGQSLKVTLGDPNKSPAEKDAVLRSFIRTKKETINTQARKLGEDTPYTSTDGVLPPDKQKRLEELRAKRDAGTLQ